MIYRRNINDVVDELKRESNRLAGNGMSPVAVLEESSYDDAQVLVTMLIEAGYRARVGHSSEPNPRPVYFEPAPLFQPKG